MSNAQKTNNRLVNLHANTHNKLDNVNTNLETINLNLNDGINTSDVAVHTKLDTIDTTLLNGITVSQGIASNLNADVNVMNISLDVSDATAHTKLDTIDATLTNGVVVSQAIGSNLKADVNVTNASISVGDSTTHTKLDTIDATLTNGVVVSQSNPTNLKVETTPAATSIQVIKGESMLAEYINDAGNIAKYPIASSCRLHGLHYTLADATSGVIVLYDEISGVISSSIPKIVIYMKGNAGESLTFPGPIEFANGISIRGVVGTVSTGTSDLNPNNGVTLFYSV